MAATKELIMLLVRKHPDWPKQRVADEVCGSIQGAKTTAKSVSSVITNAVKDLIREIDDRIPSVSDQQIADEVYRRIGVKRSPERVAQVRAHAAGAESRRMPGPASRGRGWPTWERPSDEALLALLRAVAPLVRVLNPALVAAVADDNGERLEQWSSRLRALGVDPAAYLWEGSPCGFPGVRRHAGQAEIRLFKGRPSGPHAAPECLALDDNDYPKHLWAFALTGRPFRKKGPSGYQLAHLFDHKEGGRTRDEATVAGGADDAPALHGLFTSAANTVFVPGEFLRPTDFSPLLRQLLQRRATELYGDVCRLMPPGLLPRVDDCPLSDPDNFDWCAPVGTLAQVDAFLDFRRKRVNELLKAKERLPYLA